MFRGAEVCRGILEADFRQEVAMKVGRNCPDSGGGLSCILSER